MKGLMLLLSLVEPDTLKQSKFTDNEINIIKDIALDKIHRQRILRDKSNAFVRKSVF